MPVFRRSLSLILIVTVLLVVPALPATHRPASAQSPAPIVIGTTDLPTTLDTGEAYDLASWEVLTHLYTGLTRQIPGTLDVELALATDVTISEDRLTYTFTLSADAAFTDGTPITAQTFADSITRVQTFRRFQPQYRQAADAIDPYVAQIDAPDSTTLVFTLLRPVPYFLQLVALPPYFPLHPDAITDQPVPFPDTLIGNGPYLLERFTVGEEIVLAPNPAYAYGPAPANDGIILRRYLRSADLREAMLDGAVDVAWRALFLEDMLALQDAGYTVTETPSTRTFYIALNHDREPFDDPLVREAVTALITRTNTVTEVFNGHALEALSIVPEIFPAAYAPIWHSEPDVTAAEDTLRAAAYSARGQSRLSFSISFSRQAYGDLYATAINEIDRSFNATLFVETGVNSNVETNTMISALQRGEGMALAFGWTPLVPHPAAYLEPLASSAEAIPSALRYTNSHIDTLLADAALLDDPAAQGVIYQQVQQALLDDFDLIPLWQDMVQAVSQPEINGVVVDSNPLLHFDTLIRK